MRKVLVRIIQLHPSRVHSQLWIDVQQDLESSLNLHQRSAQQKGELKATNYKLQAKSYMLQLKQVNIIAGHFSSFKHFLPSTVVNVH